MKGEFTPATSAREIQQAHYPGVETTCTGARKTAKRVLTIAKVIWIVFLIAVILLVIASTLLIANTIRLSIFSRRREIEVMKLVGATNWFIRGPFMLEGLLCGLGGSLARGDPARARQGGRAAVDPAAHRRRLRRPRAAVRAERARLLVAGLLLGAAGSGLTLRRFLQV